MIKKIIYLTIITLFVCCKTNDDVPDCSAVLCISPNVQLNLIDNTTKENIILKNNIIKENILIKNVADNVIEFILNETNGLLIVNKQNKKDTFKISINSEIITSLSFETTNPKTDVCCDYGILKNVLVEDKVFEVSDNLITIYL
jgi:hypothetical protein